MSEQARPQPATGGHPGTGTSASAPARPTAPTLTLTVDLGGTQLRAALIGSGGEVVHRVATATPRDEAHPRALVEMARRLQAEHPVDAAVIGLPGRVDYAANRLDWAPNIPAGWVPDLDGRRLTEVLGIPVSIANDADLAAAGEAYFGAGRGLEDVVYITISTGVGAGVILGRRLVRGRRSAAEIGHTLLGPATGPDVPTVETAGSGTALGRLAERAGIFGGAPEVMRRVEAGDSVATQLWHQVRAAGVAGAVNLAILFTPEMLVVGGGLGRHAPDLIAAIGDGLRRFGPMGMEVLVRRAALGDDAGLVGGAAWRDVL